MMQPSAKKLIVTKTTQDYFLEAVETASKNQGLHASDFAKAYVVGVLCDFERRESLFNDLLSPTDDYIDSGAIDSFTQLILEAHQDPSSGQKKLKRAGDIALLLTGFFQEMYCRKNAPSLTYHQELGSGAYNRLSRLARGFSRDQGLDKVFGELGDLFVPFTEVLAEVAEYSHATDENGLLHLYKRWIQEDKPYLRRLLCEKGIIPARRPNN